MRAKSDATVAQDAVPQNRHWLHQAMPPYFFAAMQEEPVAIAILERKLRTLHVNEHVFVARRRFKPPFLVR